MRILEIIMDCIAKAILSLTLVIVIAYICLIVFLYISSWWFPEFCGSYNLGNNIMVEEESWLVVHHSMVTHV